MHLVKKILKAIVNILTGFLFLILIIAIIGKLDMMFSHKLYPTYFGYTMLQIASGSMEPALKVDDVILVDTKDTNYNVNDIVSFISDNALVTHRIIFIDGDTITVKGDNNNVIDSPISRDVIIGKVVKVFPDLKIWQEVFTDPKIIIFLLITLVLFDMAISYEPKKKTDEDSKLKVSKIKTKKDPDELLELTKKIDLPKLNELLSDDNKLKLEQDELNTLKNKIKNNNPNLDKKEQEFLDYTMRLDLSEIQQKIASKIK